MTLFEWVFLIEFVVLSSLRFWFARRTLNQETVSGRVDTMERTLLMGAFVGMTLMPIIYFCTSWLQLADYNPPGWFGWLGTVCALVAAVLFWRSHADLGTQWSASLEIRERHEIVTAGVYRYVRHPMYASIWLWVVSQALLLPNWLAGLAGIVSFAPMYVLRVPREEQMMIEHFGDAYRDYMQRAGRVWPRLRRGQQSAADPS